MSPVHVASLMSPVITDPNAIFSQVVSYTAVTKCTLSFYNLTVSGKVKVKQLRIKQFYSIILRRM